MWNTVFLSPSFCQQVLMRLVASCRSCRPSSVDPDMRVADVQRAKVRELLIESYISM